LSRICGIRADEDVGEGVEIMTIGVTRTTRTPLGTSRPAVSDHASRPSAHAPPHGDADFFALIAKASTQDRPSVPQAAPTKSPPGAARAAERRRLDDAVQRASTPVVAKPTTPRTADANPKPQERAVIKSGHTPSRASREKEAPLAESATHARESGEADAVSSERKPADPPKHPERDDSEHERNHAASNETAAATNAAMVAQANGGAPAEGRTGSLGSDEAAAAQRAEGLRAAGLLDPRAFAAGLAGLKARGTTNDAEFEGAPVEGTPGRAGTGVHDDVSFDNDAATENGETSRTTVSAFGTTHRSEDIERALHGARLGLGSLHAPKSARAEGVAGDATSDATPHRAVSKSGHGATRAHGSDAHHQDDGVKDQEPAGLRDARLDAERLRESLKPADRTGEPTTTRERPDNVRTQAASPGSSEASKMTAASAHSDPRSANSPSREGSTKASPGQAAAGTPHALGIARTLASRPATGNVRLAGADSAAHELEQLARARRQDAATSAVNQMTLRQGAQGVIDLGELGTVSVSARAIAGEVDIDIRAQNGDTTAILHSASGLLEAELRKDAIDVRQLGIEKEERDNGDKGRRHRDDRHPEERPTRENHEHASDFEADFESSVRFVL
jgi:hypothetical protein